MASDKTEKKRKRASDRHERPTKKPALDLQSLPPLKSSLTKDDSELAPALSMRFYLDVSLHAISNILVNSKHTRSHQAT